MEKKGQKVLKQASIGITNKIPTRWPLTLREEATFSPYGLSGFQK